MSTTTGVSSDSSRVVTAYPAPVGVHLQQQVPRPIPLSPAEAEAAGKRIRATSVAHLSGSDLEKLRKEIASHLSGTPLAGKTASSQADIDDIGFDLSDDEEPPHRPGTPDPSYAPTSQQKTKSLPVRKVEDHQDAAAGVGEEDIGGVEFGDFEWPDDENNDAAHLPSRASSAQESAADQTELESGDLEEPTK